MMDEQVKAMAEAANQEFAATWAEDAPLFVGGVSLADVMAAGVEPLTLGKRAPAGSEVVMVGALVALAVIKPLAGSGLPAPLVFLAGLVVAALVCMVLGFAIERVASRPLRQAPRLGQEMPRRAKSSNAQIMFFFR